MYKVVLIDDEIKNIEGKPIPQGGITFTVGEKVEVKGYIFQIIYIKKTGMSLIPVGPVGGDRY